MAAFALTFFLRWDMLIKNFTQDVLSNKMLFKNFKANFTPYVFAMFAIIGGFLEAFTFVLHGGVFCNAQTGNVVMLVIRMVEGDFSSGLRYLYSIIAYIIGIIISTVIPHYLKKFNFSMAVTILEILVFTAIAFIPPSASDWFTYVTVAFVCSVQYNTFTKLNGVPLATTFCTNNIRQVVIHFYNGITQKSREEYFKSATYIFIIIFFAAGAAIGAFTANAIGNYCILICSAFLVPVLALFIVDVGKSFRRLKPSDD